MKVIMITAAAYPAGSHRMQLVTSVKQVQIFWKLHFVVTRVGSSEFS
jgi:hypothetical protein